MRALLLVFFCLLFSATPTHAQVLGDSVDPLTVIVSPQYPRPYDTILITPRSTVLDLGASEVRISVNGAVVEDGTGGKSVEATVSGPGTKTTIHVSVTNNGAVYTKDLIIVPADVTLVVEPTSTNHPFYGGGALVAPQGTVRVVALPDLRAASGARLAAQSLSYTWRLGDRMLIDQSGIGRSVLSATAPDRYRDAAVSVTVAATDDSVVGYAAVVVAPSNPVLYVYPNDPLLGVDFANPIQGTFVMRSEEETLRAVPYYFATTPSINWNLNATASGVDRDLTIRTTGNNAGSAALQVTSAGADGESAQKSFTVNFGARQSGNIFGF